MKQIAIRLLVALATFMIGLTSATLLNPFNHAASDSAARREVLKVEREYIRAHLRADTDALNDILADEFTIAGGRWFSTKSQRLALLMNPDFAFEDINTDDVQVEVNGDRAFVTGRAFVRYRRFDTERTTPTYGFRRTYEKRDGRWQVVSVRVTR